MHESFLEDINNVLSCGEVANLYANDEIEKIIGMVRPLAKAAGKLETRDVILAHYVQVEVVRRRGVVGVVGWFVSRPRGFGCENLPPLSGVRPKPIYP